MSEAKHTLGPKKAERDKEAARELFVAGYRQALDDVADYLALPKDAGFLAGLRMKAAAVKTRAVVAKAIGSKT